MQAAPAPRQPAAAEPAALGVLLQHLALQRPGTTRPRARAAPGAAAAVRSRGLTRRRAASLSSRRSASTPASKDAVKRRRVPSGSAVNVTLWRTVLTALSYPGTDTLTTSNRATETGANASWRSSPSSSSSCCCPCLPVLRPPPLLLKRELLAELLPMQAALGQPRRLRKHGCSSACTRVADRAPRGATAFALLVASSQAAPVLSLSSSASSVESPTVLEWMT
jgi:hypothetical protein